MFVITSRAQSTNLFEEHRLIYFPKAICCSPHLYQSRLVSTGGFDNWKIEMRDSNIWSLWECSGLIIGKLKYWDINIWSLWELLLRTAQTSYLLHHSCWLPRRCPQHSQVVLTKSGKEIYQSLTIMSPTHLIFVPLCELFFQGNTCLPQTHIS